MRNLLFFTILLVLSFTDVSAQKKIQGTVTNSTGEILPGVSISVRNTTKGTSTDFDGKFVLEGIKDSDILVFMYLGYLKKEVTVNKNSTFNIALDPETQQLEEVVIVGYGSKNKKNNHNRKNNTIINQVTLFNSTYNYSRKTVFITYPNTTF